MRVSYYALGCKVNEYEATAVVNRFLERGYKLVDFRDESDVCIINTCTVTANSDAKSRKVIRQAIRRNPDAVIAVMGCFSQLNPGEVAKIPGVDIVIGTGERHLLFELVEKFLREKEAYCGVGPVNNLRAYEELKIGSYVSRVRGFVKIQDGCDNFCSYCAIPFARGRVRSRAAGDIIAEIKKLVATGIKEVVLTGINTAAYGADLKGYGFANLLEDIFSGIADLRRLRISSIEITEITDDYLSVIARHRDRFCRHLHIPLQGGTDKILEKMNRKYATADYMAKIDKIRDLFPDINITTDVMVGFPGETDDDFRAARSFIEQMRFGEMHVFPYSPRPGTKAAAFSPQVPQSVKKERVNSLLELNREMAMRYRKRFEGRVLPVIVEKIENGLARGHSDNYLEIAFSLSGAEINAIYPVRIVSAAYPLSRGEVIV
ncbi:MAG: tRNA (N(6)-L-threonylcarbamoyladenosine(37)-C(2))-methylthiotransferase MtaB [Bacillota bacterium]|jgi:threonylcarbamoyladenosine tRNA methylthiotransferase MtaB|nr:tRNA (N(6)-L-threonylcarbamoyladenosine(37)-C(2))-methylthiotransferase MtaB [Bacillota bacterium]NLM32189.1 tRNA (N(6)-L-threonylcarbamoyladenosine(37)-C(2))-methylthiotransferase MtaB [Acholeplasmataceae bacterium]HOA78991.1 tRNA (N(6)-L-threonylcarbamoyladenosine(37)-C(2))-methylthiotransferase MtaB [Bacilli bacterium]HPZ27728.1 tRNA (N(6)-L-threonylcarbamoyladenosine(37)-C(2))-methylthiotransferase MtaB [Bacilli bacterium]HQC90103.1 tRNA (N(6)-L-threonylcarbamoyladenosine(37)-C(2))-methy